MWKSQTTPCLSPLICILPPTVHTEEWTEGAWRVRQKDFNILPEILLMFRFSCVWLASSQLSLTHDVSWKIPSDCVFKLLTSLWLLVGSDCCTLIYRILMLVQGGGGWWWWWWQSKSFLSTAVSHLKSIQIISHIKISSIVVAVEHLK